MWQRMLDLYLLGYIRLMSQVEISCLAGYVFIFDITYIIILYICKIPLIDFRLVKTLLMTGQVV